MAAPTPAPRSGASGGVIPAEWPAQAADTIVETIDKVRDKTTRPVLTAARAVVYGLLGVIVGTASAILAFILVVRLYENYVPGPIWPLYAGIALAFFGLGFVLLKRANGPAVPST